MLNQIDDYKQLRVKMIGQSEPSTFPRRLRFTLQLIGGGLGPRLIETASIGPGAILSGFRLGGLSAFGSRRTAVSSA